MINQGFSETKTIGRERAVQLVDNQVNALCGMSVHDLADTCEMCSHYDAMEDMTEQDAVKYIKDSLSLDEIEENIFG